MRYLAVFYLTICSVFQRKHTERELIMVGLISAPLKGLHRAID